MTADGDGWVECAQGHRHWGRHGAAGLLVRAVDADETVRVLLQHRAPWSHDGDTWGVPGGARDSHEDAVAAALREAAEETELDPAAVSVHESSVEDHGAWSYTTVLGHTPGPAPVRPCHESVAVRWVAEDEVDRLPLHPGFARAWPRLRARPLTIVVDGANVVGAQPDGWWRDRAGAARRLHARLETLRARHVRSARDERLVVRRTVLVVEGAARAAAASADDAATGAARPWAHVVAAPGSGDDAIVAVTREEVAAAAGGAVVVVTADRGLRARLPAPADAEGPRWLYALLDA